MNAEFRPPTFQTRRAIPGAEQARLAPEFAALHHRLDLMQDRFEHMTFLLGHMAEQQEECVAAETYNLQSLTDRVLALSDRVGSAPMERLDRITSQISELDSRITTRLTATDVGQAQILRQIEEALGVQEFQALKSDLNQLVENITELSDRIAPYTDPEFQRSHQAQVLMALSTLNERLVTASKDIDRRAQDMSGALEDAIKLAQRAAPPDTLEAAGAALVDGMLHYAQLWNGQAAKAGLPCAARESAMADLRGQLAEALARLSREIEDPSVKPATIAPDDAGHTYAE